MRRIHSRTRASRVPAVPAVPPPLPAAAGAVRASAPRDALERAATRAARRGDERAHRAVRARMASNKRARATPATTPATTLADANLIAQLVDVDGVAAGPELDLPPDVGARELQSLLRELLRASSANPEDDDRLTTPYAFYVDGEEVTGALAATIVERKISVEQVLKIVYQPQSVFRVRAVTRCSAAIAGHAEAVLSVAFSSDGKHLASGSGDSTIRMWNLDSQAPKHTLKGHTNWVLCIAWSADNVYLASGGMDSAVRLWDPITGEARGGPMKGHKKHVTALAWEPAHVAYPVVRFCSASADGSVRVWDAVRRACLFTMSAHTKAIASVKWGGEGLIYTASRDTTIYVWDANDGKVVRQLKGHGHWVNSLALSTEYALRTGPYDHTGKKPENDAQAKAQALTRYKAATGGKPERLVSGSDDYTMFMWEPSTTKTPLQRLTGHQQLINHVLFSPDGRYFASASFDKGVKLWDGLTGKFITSFRGHVGAVYQLAWSADSRLLMSASKDSTMKVWDARLKKLKEDLPGHADEVYAVDWSPMGTKAASGGKDKMLRFWMH